MNENKKKIRWITRTGVFLAVLIVVQVITASLGNTLVTGSFVNAILITSVMFNGLSSGIVIALVSPFIAKLIGIGPLWTLIPFIALGNITLVILWYVIGKRNLLKKPVASGICAVLVGAFGKFLVLYLSIVKIVVPLVLELPKPQSDVVSGMFSIPQLITALIGGILALIVSRGSVKKVVDNMQ